MQTTDKYGLNKPEDTDFYDAAHQNENMDKIEAALNEKADSNNPVFTGNMSMGRKEGTTEGEYSTALGYNVTASAARSYAEGYGTTASGEQSHAEGNSTTASGRTSHAQGNNTTASGTCSHAEGYKSKATAAYSHAEGYNTTASDEQAHAEGQGTTASGVSSHAEGDNTTASGVDSHAEGYQSVADGMCSHAEGYQTLASGDYSHAGGYDTEALTNQYAIGHRNDTSVALANSTDGVSTGTAFVIGNGGYVGGGGYVDSNAFRVTGQGETFAKAAYNATGADYAEFSEWADGNTENEDRRGYFVTFDEEKPSMIRKANAGDYILGIISGNPCVVGNSDEAWLGKYLFDDFGAPIYEDVEETVTHTDEETGEVTTETRTVTAYKMNPEYDKERAYVHRKDRPEWDYVGWIGVLAVRDDGSCIPGGYCTVADGGIATASERGTDTYRVLERVTDNIVKVAFR